MSVSADQVAGILVTRGDIELDGIVEALAGLGEVEVWDNSREPVDLSVYGRYEAIAWTDRPVVLVQDDDVILPPATITALLAAYEPGRLVCNVPARFRERYTDSGLVGFGAIFDRDLPEQAFERFTMSSADNARVVWDPEKTGWFRRTCDVVFTTLTPLMMLDLPYVELPYAHADSRMWRQPGHFEERAEMLRLCREVRDRVPA